MTSADTMTRTQHLAWAKERALELLDQGDSAGAMASMVSDLDKHSELRGHAGLLLGGMLALGGHMDGADEMRRWIEGFN